MWGSRNLTSDLLDESLNTTKLFSTLHGLTKNPLLCLKNALATQAKMFDFLECSYKTHVFHKSKTNQSTGDTMTQMYCVHGKELVGCCHLTGFLSD